MPDSDLVTVTYQSLPEDKRELLNDHWQIILREVETMTRMLKFAYGPDAALRLNVGVVLPSECVQADEAQEEEEGDG